MDSAVMDELRPQVIKIIREDSLDHWVRVFREFDACVEPVLTVNEAAACDHAAARGIVVDVPGPDGTPIKQIAFPIRFSGYKPEYKSIGPVLGQDTSEVLQSLGHTDREIADMKSKGIIGGL
jgi:crotonobetainyl-CoA:carnitine CoA-transferase CaiB-like acyl-CoA transferase